MRILILEDSDLLGPMLLRTLRRKGHQAFLASTIAQAEAMLVDSANIDMLPDAIVTDRELPDGDGWDFAKRVILDARLVCVARIVYMTGNPPVEVDHPYFHKGVNEMSRLWEMVENGG